MMFEGNPFTTSCVVACGRQQNAASTWSQFTSAIFVSFGTSGAVIYMVRVRVRVMVRVRRLGLEG